MQEISFALITSLLFSKLPQVKQAIAPFVEKIVQMIQNYIVVATYKCDRPSAENACECLLKVVEDWPKAREYIFNKLIVVVAEYGQYMNKTESMAKIYLLQVL